MVRNPILDELHAVRQKLLADAGGTLDALVDRLQAEEKKSCRPQYRSRVVVEAVEKKGSRGDTEAQGRENK